MIDGLDAIALRDVYLLDRPDGCPAPGGLRRPGLRRADPILASGTPLHDVFDAEMLDGGYRKKYQRAISRMVALTES